MVKSLHKLKNPWILVKRIAYYGTKFYSYHVSANTSVMGGMPFLWWSWYSQRARVPAARGCWIHPCSRHKMSTNAGVFYISVTLLHRHVLLWTSQWVSMSKWMHSKRYGLLAYLSVNKFLLCVVVVCNVQAFCLLVVRRLLLVLFSFPCSPPPSLQTTIGLLSLLTLLPNG